MQNDSVRRNAFECGRSARSGDSDAEFELLLACCALELDEAGRERIASLLKQPVEWEKFHEQASFHNVEPLAGSRLLEFRGGLPEEVVQKFERDASRHAQRALLLTRELLKILDALSEKSYLLRNLLAHRQRAAVGRRTPHRVDATSAGPQASV